MGSVLVGASKEKKVNEPGISQGDLEETSRDSLAEPNLLLVVWKTLYVHDYT